MGPKQIAEVEEPHCNLAGNLAWRMVQHLPWSAIMHMLPDIARSNGEGSPCMATSALASSKRPCPLLVTLQSAARPTAQLATTPP